MTTEDDVLRELRELVDAGGWRPLPGPPSALILLRPWPDGSVDTLAVHGVTESKAERTNPAGHPVWRQTGELAEMLAQLHALPAPEHPDAPHLSLPGDSADRAL